MDPSISSDEEFGASAKSVGAGKARSSRMRNRRRSKVNGDSNANAPAGKPSDSEMNGSTKPVITEKQKRNKPARQRPDRRDSRKSVPNGTDDSVKADKHIGGEEPEHNKRIDSAQYVHSNKRFYFSIIENSRGRFCKLVQISRVSIKRSVHMDIFIFDQITAGLEELMDYNSVTPELPMEANLTGDKDVLLKALDYSHKDRKFTVHLKSNKRGRFIRLTQMSLINSTMSVVFIPIEALQPILNIMHDLLDKHFADAPDPIEDYFDELADVGSKKFYFTLRNNDRGRYLIVSELKNNNYRNSSIVIPENGVCDFMESLKRCQGEITRLAV